MPRELQAIPITILTTIINMMLLFRYVEINEDYAIQVFFPILIACVYGTLTYRMVFSCNKIFFMVVGLISGVGVFLYLHPFQLATEIYMGLQLAIIIAFPEIKLQQTQKTDAKQMQSTIHEDIANGMKNKDICEKYGLEPYQVTRIKQKLEKQNINK